MPVSRSVIEKAIAEERTLDEIGDEFNALGKRYSGKVRENFSRGNERLIVVTDRVSAFDVVLGTIPFKGQVLNQLAHYWFNETKDLFPNHVIDVPDAQVTRAIECEPIPVEMVVRGYLTGVSSTSIWTAYKNGEREFCGHKLPDGMKPHQKLHENIVTPSTKAAKGDHDRSVSKHELFELGVVEPEVFDQLEKQCLDLFAKGQEIAAKRGYILVDTKYELGRAPDGTIVLIDEIHTPDSSRYWYIDGYEDALKQGDHPRSMDKEFVRRWLVSQGFHGEGQPPALTPEIRIEAAERYIEIYEGLTGLEFSPSEEAPRQRIQRALGL